MFQEVSGLEQRLSELQAQIDRLTISLQLWRDGQERITPADERLSRFADEVGEVLDAWSTIGDRHARAVDALEQQIAAFAAVEKRFHRDSAEPFLAVHQVVQQEWASLSPLELEPAGVRREQVAELAHACVSAAVNSHSTSRATDVLNAGEVNLQRQLADIVRLPAVHSPVEQPVAVQPVVRSDDPVRTIEPAALDGDMIEPIAELQVRLRESEARTLDVAGAQRRVQRTLGILVVLLVVAVAGGAWWASMLQRRISGSLERLSEVEERSARVADAAAEQVSAARADAERLAASARSASVAAQTMSAVLAAPDLVRYGLSGVDGPATAQLLWSRSRGLVLSAARLPALAPGMTYQVWLLTSGDATSAGLIAPDDGGRATLVSDVPPRVRPVVGVAITVEPSGGSAAASSQVVAMNKVVPPTPAP